MKSSLIFTAVLFSSAAFAAPAGAPNTLKMTCAQAQAYVTQHSTAVLATGDEWGTYSYTDCGTQDSSNQVPGFACTKDVAECYVGNYCEGQSGYTPVSHFQGTNFCHAPNR